MKNDITKEQIAVVLRELGKRGGKARAAKLSKEELSKQGTRAINARWAKRKADLSLATESKSEERAESVTFKG